MISYYQYMAKEDIRKTFGVISRMKRKHNPKQLNVELEAIEKYDPEYGVFEVYAAGKIVEAINQGIRGAAPTQGDTDTLKALAFEVPAVDGRRRAIEIIEAFRVDLQQVPKRHRPLLEARVLSGATLEEAGAMIDVGRRRASELCGKYLQDDNYFTRTREFFEFR